MFRAWRSDPQIFAEAWKQVPTKCNAFVFSRTYQDCSHPKRQSAQSGPRTNPLWNFFQNRTNGAGIWKWEHYFEIYHRHLPKFVGLGPNVFEIGIYSGGSLEMWRSYFGEESRIYGVDIEPACKSY